MLPGVSPRGWDPAGPKSPAGNFGQGCGKSSAASAQPSPCESARAGKEKLGRFGKAAGRAGDALPAPCLHPHPTPLVPRMGWVPPALPWLLAPKNPSPISLRLLGCSSSARTMILGQNHDFGACPHLTGDRLGDAAVTAGTGAPGRCWGAGALFFDLILFYFFSLGNAASCSHAVTVKIRFKLQGWLWLFPFLSEFLPTCNLLNEILLFRLTGIFFADVDLTQLYKICELCSFFPIFNNFRILVQ